MVCWCGADCCEAGGLVGQAVAVATVVCPPEAPFGLQESMNLVERNDTASAICYFQAQNVVF